MVTWEKLNEVGYFPQPANPDWGKATPPSLAFFTDPKKTPLSTPTGLIEFESSLLKENFPNDKERLPVAHYVRGGPESEGWTHDEDPMLSKKAKDYPLLMQSAVREWGHHSGQTDISLTREIIRVMGPDGYSYSPVWIHPKDAAARGIRNKDIVKVFNERGIVLGAARVVEKIIPGTVHMDKAGGADMIDPVGINRGGSPNCHRPAGYCFPARLRSCSERLSGSGGEGNGSRVGRMAQELPRRIRKTTRPGLRSGLRGVG